MIRAALGTAAKISGGTAALSSTYLYYQYETDEGSRRAMQAYRVLVPVVLHYRWVEAKHKVTQPTIEVAESNWKSLDERYAKPTVAKLAALQGVYTKYCQTAAGLVNTFGDAWIREFRTLENEVPPRPAQAVYQTIREETGKSVEEIFAHFDPAPLGSASIGQVHKATLRQGGRQVAVKVQYNDAERVFRRDIQSIRTFCTAFAPEHVVTLDAVEQQNVAELDYRIEAQNLRDVAVNMTRRGLMPREVVVPQPIADLSTRRMLVMEFLPGPKLIDGIRAYVAEWAQQHGTTLEQLQEEARRRLETGQVPDRYRGPSAWQIDVYRYYLRMRTACINVGIAIYNKLWRLLSPTTFSLSYHTASIPPNAPRIIDILMRVHGVQLLADGTFQADPHGGQFLCMPDGRIGLLDYGATKRLTWNERMTACLIYAALRRKDDAMLFELCKIGGYKSKYMKKDILMKLMQLGWDSWGPDVTGGKNLQQFLDELKEADPWEEVPDNFVMAKFLSIRIRALALGMNYPVRCSEWWGPLAEEILVQEGLPYETWDREQILKYKPEMNIQKHKFAR